MNMPQRNTDVKSREGATIQPLPAIQLFSDLMSRAATTHWTRCGACEFSIGHDITGPARAHYASTRYSDGRTSRRTFKSLHLAALHCVRAVLGDSWHSIVADIEEEVAWKYDRDTGVHHGGIDSVECPACDAVLRFDDDGLRDDSDHCPHYAFDRDYSAYFLVKGTRP